MARKPRSHNNKLSNAISKTKKWNVAIYIRLSKEEAGKDESLSVTNQRAILLKYIEELQKDEDIEIIDTYIDDGISGSTSEREQLQRMLKDIDDGKINCVIVKDVSRLARNYIEGGMYIDYTFVQKGVRFISTELPKLDSFKDPDGINSIIVPITNIINEEFLRQTSIKIRKVQEMMRQEGKFTGGFAPYGYIKDENDKHKFFIDDNASDILKKVAQWIIYEGYSATGVVKKLNKLGIPNPTRYKENIGLNYKNAHSNENDGLWTSTTLLRLLRNPVYLGHMVQGKQKTISYKIHDRIIVPQNEWAIVLNTHEPIFSQETWDLLQEKLNRDVRTPPKKTQVHLFGGYLYCADCDKAMRRTTGKGTYIYYYCSTYRMKDTDKCTKHGINHKTLLNDILKAIKYQISLVISLEDTIKEALKQRNNNPNVDNYEVLLNEHEKAIEEATKIVDNLYIDWKNGDITRERYLRLSVEYEDSLAYRKGAIKTIHEEIEGVKNALSNDSFIEVYKRYSEIETIDRDLLADLVHTIYVYENGHIEIVFRFQDQIKRVLQNLGTDKNVIKLEYKNSLPK